MTPVRLLLLGGLVLSLPAAPGQAAREEAVAAPERSAAGEAAPAAAQAATDALFAGLMQGDITAERIAELIARGADANSREENGAAPCTLRPGPEATL